MRIFRHLPSLSEPQALAIGNFDGLHLGHQALLHALKQVAAQRHELPSVMTFEPHPRELFTPERAPARLSSLREKLEYFSENGIANVFICRFNRAFAALTADEFMHDVLRRRLNAGSVLIGEDFRFGAKRAGGRQELAEVGFHLPPFPDVVHQGVRISSTLVRETLHAGQLDLASQLLGRPYSISGNVVHGAKRGRQLGFPTANVHMRHERPALTGVYAVKLNGLNGVANLGVRPTIAGVPKLLLEVHVLDFAGDLYNQHVHVTFLHKLREEQKFSDLNALKAQIARDVAQANDYFKRS